MSLNKYELHQVRVPPCNPPWFPCHLWYGGIFRVIASLGDVLFLVIISDSGWLLLNYNLSYLVLIPFASQISTIFLVNFYWISLFSLHLWNMVHKAFRWGVPGYSYQISTPLLDFFFFVIKFFTLLWCTDSFICRLLLFPVTGSLVELLLKLPLCLLFPKESSDREMGHAHFYSILIFKQKYWINFNLATSPFLSFPETWL